MAETAHRAEGLQLVRRLFRVGGSVGIVVPPLWIEARGLSAGKQVELILGDELRIRPIRDARSRPEASE